MESQNIMTPVIQLKLNLSAMSTRLFNLHKAAKRKVELFSHCEINRSLQANVHGFLV